MNQDQVKERLQSLRPSKTEFTVLFTGKASKKVNGLYYPAKREILIHNRSFTNENLLMYTAIHEYAHHLHQESDPTMKNTARAHTNAFWAIFHGLLAEAIGKGLYHEVFDDDAELVALTAELRGDLKEMAVILKRIGRRLLAALEICSRIGARFEDYTDRVLRMSRMTVKIAIKAFQLALPEDIGIDGVKLVAGVKGEDARAVVAATLEAGKTQEEAKAAAKTTVAQDPEQAQTDKLRGEQRRIKRTIERLEHRLEDVEHQLQEIDPSAPVELDLRVGA